MVNSIHYHILYVKTRFLFFNLYRVLKSYLGYKLQIQGILYIEISFD